MAVRLLAALPWPRDSFELRIHGSWVAVLQFFSADPFVDYREGQVPRLDVKPAGTTDGKGSGARGQNCVGLRTEFCSLLYRMSSLIQIPSAIVYRLCQYCANSAVSVVQCFLSPPVKPSRLYRDRDSMG
ncbi:hypothetical protein FGSG_12804 [Fusarium graminearum PH-1]|uniref:Chromosome 3, complete genome n=1 Tax=Gibberella zeae (strain ATCC MYA-4620 / CBS 123657 / FGSC 9075 / NRRL 31084 / PH-1) TaxID=229533 RepID=I1S7I1_GIBZE|nr:hypothetical protein FGSG_12804 [Fusarium graminearum PH-1]ESU11763.1 hypothetical protein FGSG_12804 [Fusarium graminearum PH-1]EYB29681.1 hypothetical protein FG05_12804 [Fusarium graminearum]CEF86252.1 unnamed protein product [Fusarium graminearum]|eukprot:XP_011324339.1 hypothetical protein FGSG_12804 [Fusarium graminearum PH-1]